MKKITAITAAAALSASVLLSGCGGSQAAMKIGEYTVSQGDVEIVTDAYFSSYGDYEASKELAVSNLRDAITAYAVAQSRGLTLTDEEQSSVTQGKANFAKTFGSASEYNKARKKAGADEEIIEAFIAQPLYEQKLSEAAQLPEPTDDDLKAYFKEHYLRAKHILLMFENESDTGLLERRAQDLLKRAQNGENFDELVTTFSEDPGSSSAPDGYIFTDGEMVQEFEDAVKSIQPGEFTMCESSYGYHVIQRLPLDESDEKFNEFFETYKSSVSSAKERDDLTAAIQSMAEEDGITVEVLDDVINAIPSPTPQVTEEPETADGSAETTETAE